jgi:hypothetical protein
MKPTEGARAMPPYPLICFRAGCDRPAIYKIAARWSDGVTQELKTYALSCQGCLADLYAGSVKRQSQCRLSGNETLERPGIYQLVRGQRDRQLQRLRELEDQLEKP